MALGVPILKHFRVKHLFGCYIGTWQTAFDTHILTAWSSVDSQ